MNTIEIEDTSRSFEEPIFVEKKIIENILEAIPEAPIENEVEEPFQSLPPVKQVCSQ